MVDSSRKVPIFWIESEDRHSHKITRHKNQTLLYADPRKETGSGESLLSGSQHLLLDLKAGESVSVWQQAEPMESVKDVSFCVSLINLNQTNFQNLLQIEIDQNMTSTDFNLNSLVKNLIDEHEIEMKHADNFTTPVIKPPVNKPRSSLDEGCSISNLTSTKCSLIKRNVTEEERWYNPEEDLREHNCTLSADKSLAASLDKFESSAVDTNELETIESMFLDTDELQTFETFFKFR